jgi:hypothetical protein
METTMTTEKKQPCFEKKVVFTSCFRCFLFQLRFPKETTMTTDKNNCVSRKMLFLQVVPVVSRQFLFGNGNNHDN